MNIATLLDMARSAEAAGNAQAAVQLCGQALFLDEDCVDALLILGSLAARQGRVRDAEAFLRKAANADPDCYDAVRWLTTLLIGRDGGGDAIFFGQEAIRLKPNEPEAYAILGLAGLGAGNLPLAIDSFERAIELNPQMAGAHHNLGIAFQQDQSFEEAVAAFRRAIELAPALGESYLHLGGCYLALDKGDEALASSERALELLPKSSAARHLRADAYFAAVHGENGLEHIRSAVARDPESAFPHALLGSRLQEQGDFAEAEASILRSIEIQPTQGLAYYGFAHNRKMGEGDREIIARMEKASQQPELLLEERQYVHFALGKAYDDLGDFERVMDHLDLAHEQSEAQLQQQAPPHIRAHRFTQLFSKEVLERFADVAIDSDEPIFIFGMPRSGTTLLEQIVSRHSTVGAAGELFFWRDSCRRIVNLREGALNLKALRSAGNKYLDLLRETAPGKAHVTDKFPSNYVYMGMLHLIFPRATFIHARRNPLDTCLSIYMRPFSTNQGLGRTREEIVDTYKAYRQSIRSWREILGPNRFLDVDYEQLVQNPEEWTRKVIAHCGLDWEDACLTPQEGNRRVVTFSKWQVRQPVYTTSVERWRNYEPWLGNFRELVDG